ncbi:coproporphyrinogen dehydrogenase HemZ [Crassaminicella profunda]|uniref:coproporphyrinogen dehydrogenase HemZ n=1 Tax=Crassaminicella profunda TaxID=1286698 RepID=UPI001CA6C237|nr:coproporphyrinogen dehydrogenase HemZ [Crassaminicella profunda]QZY57045.1 coproporphyrinogen dehydrogenase HemZ [Crassaminicella profunda]
MIKVFLKGHDYQYEVSELLKVFEEPKKIEFIENEALVDDQSFLLVSKVSEINDEYDIITQLIKNHKVMIENTIKYKKDTTDHGKIRKILKRKIKLSIYDTLSKFYEIHPLWGILTGIRPTKIVHELMDQKLDLQHIRQKLKENYRMSEEKIDLVTKIAQIERPVIKTNNGDAVSVYVSIPFCPTRCIYCSFPSNPLDKGKNLIKEYLKALIYEIKETGEILKEHNKKVETLYIGGGTPTTLSHEELEMLIKAIKKHIDLKWVKEITVEAGRPDTITMEKLMVLKREGVERISINPQTMNQKTLEVIGRSHTAEDIIHSYQMAKKIGFDTINMDMIIGLPGETPEMVEKTMKEIEKLNPENLTVHTLAVKKTSRLRQHLNDYPLAKEEEARKMLQITQTYAERMGLIPYYMYRQKYMLGNLENIGYAKAGHEGIYNIQIMEEKQSIIALGAGAVSKIYYQEENRLERVPNVTNVEHYIARVEEMVERKRKEIDHC